MSVDLSGLINRIPQEKLNELVSKFTADTTAQEVLDVLSSEGIDASDEEAQALTASLLLKDSKLLEVSDETLKDVAGGEEGSSMSWREIDRPDNNERQMQRRCPFCCY